VPDIERKPLSPESARLLAVADGTETTGTELAARADLSGPGFTIANRLTGLVRRGLLTRHVRDDGRYVYTRAPPAGRDFVVAQNWNPITERPEGRLTDAR
jgi:hypothetical protein